MNSIASKLITVVVFIFNPQLPSKYRWFIHQKIRSHIYQYRFFLKDYIIKKPYKVIDFNGEFQQELLYVIPFAYWHYKNGTLLKTASSKYTSNLYWFSKQHSELYSKRDFESNSSIKIPNAPHNAKLDKSKWIAPNFKRQFSNSKIKFDKPILIIANRYNTEWGSKEPISFFSIAELDKLFTLLKTKYQIIYNRPPSSKIVNDNSEVLNLGDLEFIKSNHKEILLLEDLEDYFNLNIDDFNHLQLQVYAQSANFISVHGGTATLCSFFGEKNIIFSKKGLEHRMNEFKNVFPQLSCTNIYVAKTFEKVLDLAQENY